MISVPASELRDNFAEYERRAVDEPVEVTHADQTRSYLISETFFKEMMASYRRAIPVEELSDTDAALIERADVESDTPYNLDDIPDVDATPARRD
ncbi:MAG: type toxin-antitoxin system Phd/YefM family antitoxin [Tardiphaga sp.]|nr:type toxin-antitoxin system Phd/YefM family antitoxin [Tardiphaga sp.]